MTKYTQRQLKNLVAMGAAIDVPYANDTKDIPEPYIQIGYSCGMYGCNGMLLRGHSGQLYAVTSRTTAVWIF